MSWPCLHGAGDGVVLLVTVIPNAKLTQAVGLHDGCLRVRLAAPALEGRANDALVAWLADQLQLTRRQVHLLKGATARRKRLQLDTPLQHASAWLDGLGLPPAP
jgi:uncharacterized protein (TIGR00251 family)